MSDPAVEAAREKVAMALHAAESSALESGSVPGYTVLADAAIAAHLDALKADGYAVIKLPEPGPLSDHHADSEKVWYFGQYGEFTLDSYDHSLHDTEGNCWGADELREMARAALAAADTAEAQR